MHLTTGRDYHGRLPAGSLPPIPKCTPIPDLMATRPA